MKAILTYHSIDDSGSVISVTNGQLERHLDALASRGASIVSLETLFDLPDDSDAVALTFDDGYANFATVAAPLLAARSVPATVFVVAGAVGGSNAWESTDSRSRVPALPLMNWDQIREVSSLGFEIGGHGVTHRSLAGIARRELEDEVQSCFSSIEANLGRAPSAFAFPYGACDETAIAVVAASFGSCCTTQFGCLGDDSSRRAAPRLDMYYFRNGRALYRYGGAEFAAYIRLRQLGRALGRNLRSATSKSSFPKRSRG